MKPKKIKILLIEDDNFLSGIYVAKFEMEGFEIIAERRGEEGQKIAKKEKPDVILLDILLPGKDGFAVLKELKTDAATSRIPVIVMTNLSEDSNVKKAFDLGATDYLVKAHFLPAEIIDKVKKVISKK
ncbi:response regulator [Candidatus Falkowbacteria bacterium]|nr:response regulator [Candidatus Falkowbacteria bacterium]